MRRITSALLLAALTAFAQESALRWMPVASPKIEVAGLPWFQENHGEFWRLPAANREAFRKEVWSLSLDPTGGRIRFRTDSSSVALRLEWQHGGASPNQQTYGHAGVDLYVGNTYWDTAIPDKDAAPGKVYEHVHFKDQPRVMRDITIYLALYASVKVLGIGLNNDAAVEVPRPFAIARPVVFYGTSITQGGAASRPGMSYQAILGRKLNLDHVNLGFSGNGKGDAEVARAVATIEASAYVLDYGQNNGTVESLAKVYDPFIGILRERRPDTPILCITPIYRANEATGSRNNEQMRGLIRNVVSRRIAAGDAHLQLIEGTDLLGPSRADGLVDGAHPNDLGFHWMAEGLIERLRKVLGLQ
jgi:hypothetical protein